MHRRLLTSIVTLALTASVLALGSTSSVAAEPTGDDSTVVATPTEAEAALETAQQVLTPEAAPATDLGTGTELTAPADADLPDATLALRDLFLARPSLDGVDQALADRLLARPTDGAADQYGQGYTTSSLRRCSGHFCVHWVTSGADAAPNSAWVDTNLKVLNQVWAKEVGTLNYRKPVPDGRRGGNAKLDVYLKQIGTGVYGYCAPEAYKPGRKREASGYCVLDNNFARSEFGAAPVDSLRVTAAHEFFHAIQFGYDFAEDGWLMEATATWMEERVADAVNDNRQYLPYGQVGQPQQSLDVFGGVAHYGNWAFFEYLSNKYGRSVVRKIWNRAGEFRGAGHDYSTQAVTKVLAKRGGFTGVFRAYASANTATSRTYPEGRAWPSARATKRWSISPGSPTRRTTLKINHMASRNVVIKPSSVGRKWTLRVSVAGPSAATAPAAVLRVHKRSGWAVVPVRLDKRGDGSARIAFSSTGVRAVTLTAVNASTRFTCNRGTSWSCGGRAKDNGLRFRVTATLVRAR